MAISLEARFRSYPGFCGSVSLLLGLLIVCAPLKDVPAADQGVVSEKGDIRHEFTVRSIEKDIFDPEEPLPESNEGLDSSLEDESRASSQEFDSGPAREINEQLRGTGLTFDPFARGGVRPEDAYQKTGQY